MPLFFSSTVTPASIERVERRAHVVGLGADQFDLAAGDRRGAGIAARLDPVGHHRVGRAVQAVACLRSPAARCRCPSICAPIATSRLHRSTISGSRAALSSTVVPLAGHRRHQRILGRADRHHREADSARPRSRPPGALRPHIARRELRSRRRSPQAPSGAGRSAGCRSRSRRAATPCASPARPSSGPSTRIEARILRTMS